MFQLKGMLNMRRWNKNPSTTNVNGWHRAKPLPGLRSGTGALGPVELFRMKQIFPASLLWWFRRVSLEDLGSSALFYSPTMRESRTCLHSLMKCKLLRGLPTRPYQKPELSSKWSDLKTSLHGYAPQACVFVFQKCWFAILSFNAIARQNHDIL